MKRRTFLKQLSAVTFIAGALDTLPVFARPLQPVSPDHPAVHGMVVLGTHQLYLSHLPLFSAPEQASPHNYQVILEVELSQKGENVGKNYRRDREKSGQVLYTFEPEKFVLPTLQFGATAGPPVRSFRGKLYRGHFERNGTPIADQVTVNVTKVIHFRAFEPAKPRPEQLQYLVFGNEKECFAAHYITRPPDFDHLLPVTFEAKHLPAKNMQLGFLATFPNLKNAAANRLRNGQTVEAVCTTLNGTSQSFQLPCKIGADIYFEENELAS